MREHHIVSSKSPVIRFACSLENKNDKSYPARSVVPIGIIKLCAAQTDLVGRPTWEIHHTSTRKMPSNSQRQNAGLFFLTDIGSVRCSEPFGIAKSRRLKCCYLDALIKMWWRKYITKMAAANVIMNPMMHKIARSMPLVLFHCGFWTACCSKNHQKKK